ncbi:MAG: hypothetical protein ACLT9M_19100 [Anaerobutyricum hallii]
MVRDFSQKTVQELYETIRVNVDEEEQWKVFDFVEDFFMEELEIGDYINDINSYHLHMFDKHDVTTKKFDAIVEKAGKVDANYAAQIEGYCSLLGEYGKKFEAVCAMLQPEKLRLSPDKYREKLEGINTGYQNAKDTHEQEQSAYEAELYEIETVWYKKMLDKAEDYLIRSAECIVLGNFTDEVTVLGVGVQIVLGIFDLDLPCDIRDIIADVRNLAQADEIKWDMIAMLALDLIGLIPVIGALKYSDEIGTLFKNADKVSVVARSTDGAGVLAKHADEAGAWLHGVKVFKYSDETAEAVASGEKLLKESGTIYESFADMMSPEDAKRYLDFLENGSREGLTSAELADALLVSQKVGYEDVWDLRNVGDALESGINSYADFSKAISDIGMRSDLTDAQKISELQKLFESSNYKADINVPSDIQYVKGFDAKGNVIYDWPPKLGFDESTIKSISRTDSLPDTWDRYGYMGGSNFADVPPTGKYTYSERAIPYVENEAAYHTGAFNNATYFDKIDAIKNGDIDGLNTILSREGIANVDSSYFKNLQNTYNDFIEDTANAVGSNIDATYGLKGTAASWGDMSGGAGQYVTPLNGSTMKRLGIIN